MIAAHAEPFAKAAFLAPTVRAADEQLRAHGLAGLLFDVGGQAHQIGAAADFVVQEACSSV